MIKVYVIEYGRPNWYMRYVDPATGLQVTRSTGTKVRRDADRVAAKWEAELNAGEGEPGRVSWDRFCERYETEHLSGLKASTAARWREIAAAVVRHVRPTRIDQVTAESISRMVAKIRETGVAETTIDSRLGHLKAALNWAVSVRLLNTCPRFPKIRRSKRNRKSMKGRPLTDAEFERYVEAVPAGLADRHGVIHGGDERVEAWRFYVRALWLSGLRVEESLDFWWDGDDGLVVDMSGEFPMLRIPAESEKGHQDRLLPIVPDFAHLLRGVPEESRTGRVFALSARKSFAYRKWHVSRIGTKIGKASGVVVSTKNGKTKHASLHDLRRSFGLRWSRKVMPPVLMELMRHEDIATTMNYYVGQNAEETARLLWGLGNTSGNSDAKR